MAENKHDGNAQEKGFNSTAAYGDPKEQTHEKPDPAALRDNENSPFNIDPDGNVSTGDGGEPGTVETDTGNYTGNQEENVRTTDSVTDDLASIDVSREGLPANDQAKSDVPADPSINDVPDADRSIRDSPEHLSQNARDRTRRNDS